MKDKENQESENIKVSKAITNFLNEHCGGCFFVITCDQDGNPLIGMNMDKPFYKNQLAKWLAAVARSLNVANGMETQNFERKVAGSMGINYLDFSEIAGIDMDFDEEDDDDDDDEGGTGFRGELDDDEDELV